MKLLEDPNAYWTMFYADTNRKAWLTELNFYEKQNDGSILSPILSRDKNGGMSKEPIWLRFSCSDKNAISLGEFRNGAFGRGNLLPPSHFGHQIRHFFCPTTLDNGKRILFVHGIFDDNKKIYSYWGIDVNDLQVTNITSSNLISGIWYNLKLEHEQDKIIIGDSSKFEVNCKEKSLFSSLDKKTYAPSNDDGKHLRFLVDTVCRVNDVLFGISFNEFKREPTSSDQKNLTSLSQEKIKLSMDEAKIKCKEIGFKEKTEKFGGCVMELIK